MQLLNKLQALDLRLLAWMFRYSSRRAITPLAKAISHSGDGYLHFAIPLLLLAIGSPQAPVLVQILMVALAIERCLYRVLKNGLKRPRPQDFVPNFRSLIAASDQFSFPSGHSSAAFLLATSLCIVYGSPVLAVYLWAVGVACSRVLLGVHFPGDTLAGATMGSSIALIVCHYQGVL